MNQGNTITEASQVAVQIQAMDDMHNELHKAVVALDDRLSQVLVERPPEKPLPEVKASDDLVPLALVLWNKNNFLRELFARINCLRDRIEL